jgi:hypothetical protein
MKKECSECKENKSLNKFYKHIGMSDGHINKCIECFRAYARLRLRIPEVSQRRNLYAQKPEIKAKMLIIQKEARKTRLGQWTMRWWRNYLVVENDL